MGLGDIALTSSMRQNLINLQGTTNLLSRTQDRLASGKRINTALDDPVNFFASQDYIARSGDLSGRKYGMLDAVQTLRATDTGITAIMSLLEQAKGIATSLNIVTVRQDFTKDIIDPLKTGSDNLILADMNEEGANMLMLQTRQSLGTTSLSLASQASQAVLRLF